MTHRQIPQAKYLPPHLVEPKWITVRELVQMYPPQTPEAVMAGWKRIAEEDRKNDPTSLV